ncbi:hypothetical protein N9L27_06530 [Candidatus Poseidoniales archaeon]|nr:hypothetical protein [Candidatus Poseidoniales archaeon]MDA8748081.1 hypothetical protein [Candidatus Poseidoniales archaeon]
MSLPCDPARKCLLFLSRQLTFGSRLANPMPSTANSGRAQTSTLSSKTTHLDLSDA